MSKEFIEAGNTHEIKLGKMKRVETNGKAILICNVDGEFYAVDDMCTHEDSSLYLGCMKGDLVQCSLHGAKFSVKTGEPMEEPGEIPLQTYELKVEDGRIFVKV